ncbi:hypothetical protein [Cesiribacter sp. SM1]|uniref:hypothetical protein n=1 Tax=Cesiribacter sp. SM1 TaxID=2861196 RepID=UPI001CD21373|nr:hypothetical protein [Cesiribacter sp. SM1]
MTAKEAVFKGHLAVSLPTLLIFVGVAICLYYLSDNALIHKLLFMPGAFVVAPPAAWLYWKYALPRWLVWALTNVEDHSELKFYAVNRGLVSSESSFHTGNFKERKLLEKLNQEYLIRQQQKVFKDDLSVPEIDEIGYSRSALITYMVIMLIFFVLGIYLLTTLQNWIFGLMIMVYGGYVGFKCFRKLISGDIPLKIGNHGIEIKGKTYRWGQIHHEKPSVEGSGRNRSNFLVFSNGSEMVKFKIDDLDLTPASLRNILIFYRARYNHTKANRKLKDASL